MNELENAKEAVVLQQMSCVRFSISEAKHLLKDRLLTGKSIPTLLKERYFKFGPLEPVMSAIELKEISTQLVYFNRNLNQLTRYIHSGINGTVIDDFQKLFQTVNGLLENMSVHYGNRKNSV